MTISPLLISLPIADRPRECVLGLPAATDAEVELIVERARRAGAVVTGEPGPQPWGYAATFTDPDGHLWMVTSAPRPK